MNITSPVLLSIAYITEQHNCQYPETILSVIKCIIYNFRTPKETNKLTITISPYKETVCFTLKPIKKTIVYTISVNRNSKSVFIIPDFLGSVSSFTNVILTQNICCVYLFFYSSCGFQTLPCVCGRRCPLLLCKDLEPVSIHFYILNLVISEGDRSCLTLC